MLVCKIGDPRQPLSERFYPIDTKDFFLREQVRISGEVVTLYQKGWSLRDIARECRCSKSKVRASLKKAGVKLRDGSIQPTPERMSGGKPGALPYYGFCYFEGRIVPDPREFPILKLILRMWKDQNTIHQITQELNRSKTLSRKGKQWSWAAVQNIVKRFEEGVVALHQGSRFEIRGKKEIKEERT